MTYSAAKSTDLTNLIGKNSPVNPGDTIKLAPTLFTGPFESFVSGSDGLPVTIKGDGACLDGGSQTSSHVLTLNGEWIDVEGIEVTHHTDLSFVKPAPAGLSIWADYCNCRRVRIHDCGQGVQSFGGGRNLSIEDSDLYHNGASDHDHAIYAHNPTIGWKRFERCRIWGNQTFGVHLWGSQDVRDMYLFDCSMWNNDTGHVVCGGSLMKTLQFHHNAGWYPPGTNAMHLNCSLENAGGFMTTGHHGLTVTDNYFAHGHMVNLSWWRQVIEQHNTYVDGGKGRCQMKCFMGPQMPPTERCIGNTYWVGSEGKFQYGPLPGFVNNDFAAWRKDARQDSDSKTFSGLPFLNYYHVSEGPDGGLLISVFNWRKAPVVLVPFTPYTMRAGDHYSVEYCGAPGTLLFADKVFNGYSIGLPMTKLPAAPTPFRALPAVCTMPTAPEFAAFVVRKLP